MQKASTLANELWPYLLPRIQRVNHNGGSGGVVIPGGSGGSSTLAGLDDVAFAGLTDGQTIAYQASTSHWVNVVPSGGGGSSYFAGLGIDITGATISTKRQAAGGLAADSNGLYIAKPVDSGLNLSAAGLAVGAGDGIDIFGGTVAVDSTEIVDTTKGLGVSSNSIYVHLTASGGLNFNPDGSLRLGSPDDLDYATTNATLADGHTHNILSSADVSSSGATTLLHAAAGDLGLQNLTLAGDLNFILGNRNITGSNTLHIQPATDLYLDPGGNVVFPDDQVARTPTFNQFIAGIDGWNIAWLGGYKHQLSISNILVDNLFAHKFTADEARVQRGEWFLTRSYGMVETAFTVPAIGANVDVWFEEAPGLGNAKLFLPNNWIEFRTIDWGTGLVIQTVWFQVVDAGASDYVQRQAATTNVPSRQQWRLKRMDGGFTGAIIAKGEVGADFGLPTTAMPAGQMGQGVVYASSLYEPDFGPFIEVQVFDSIAGTSPHFQNKVRMGNLQTTVDYTAPAWGFAAADDLSVLPSAGMSGFAVDAQLGARFFNTDLTIYAGDGIETVKLDRTRGLALRTDSGDYSPVRMVTWWDDLNVPPAGRGDPQAMLVSTYFDTGSGGMQRLLSGEVLASSAVNEEAHVQLLAQNFALSLTSALHLSTHTLLSTGSFGTLSSLASSEIRLAGNVLAGFVTGSESNIAQMTVHDSSSGTARRIGLLIEQGGTGDAVLHWNLTGGVYYSAGVDNSDGDKFKISASQSLGSADIFVYNPATGAVTINGFDAAGSTAPVSVTAGDGITVVGPQISVNATVVRTTTHIDTLSGSGLSGGGDLSATRSLSVLVPGGGGLQLLSSGIVINDTLAGTGLTMAAGKVLNLDTTAFVPPSKVINTTGGIQGGGPLSAPITLSIDFASVEPGLTVTDGLTVDGSVVRVTRQITTLSGTGLSGGGYLSSDLGLSILLAAGSPGLSLASGLQVDGTVARTTQHIYTTAPLAGGGQFSGDLTLILNLATPSGLSTVGGLNVADSLAGAGLLWSAPKVLAVDASLFVPATRVLTAGAGMTGGGDLSADRTFNVVAGDGTLSVAVDDVRVNQAFAFAWSGNQTWTGTVGFNGAATFASTATFNGALNANALATFNSGGLFHAGLFQFDSGALFHAGAFQFDTAPQLNANLAFIGADRTITASANLAITPVANLTLSPTGGLVYLPDAVEERSATFSDLVTGISGFRLWSPTSTTRQLTIGSIKTDNLVTAAFTTNLVRLEQGDSYWGSGYGIVETSFNLPTVGATIDAWFENVPNKSGDIFAVGDKLQARLIIWAVGLSLQLVWFNVVSRVAVDDPNFRQQWRLTRLAGGVDGALVSKGQVLDDAGAIGSGWIHVTSLTGGPYMEFGLQTTAIASVPQFIQYVRIGQLSGTVDYASSAWGFVTGNNLGVGPTAGFSGLTLDKDKGMRLFNTAYQLYSGANLVMAIEKIGGISIESTGSAFNTVGWYDDLGAFAADGTLNLAGQNQIGSLGVVKTSPSYNLMDILGQGFAGTYTNGAVRLRALNSGGSAYNVWVDATGVFFGSGAGVKSQTAGFIQDATSYFAGSVGVGVAAPSTLLHVKKDQGTITQITVENANAGGFALFTATSDASSVITLGKRGSTASAYKWIAAGDAYLYNNVHGDISILNDYASGGINFAGGGASTPQMVILPSGNVGIGTSGPTATVHVVETAATGSGLRVERNLTATSTDSPLVSILQNHAGDDQDALWITQVGSGGYGLSVRQVGSSVGTWPVMRFGYNPPVYQLYLQEIVTTGVVRYSWSVTNNSTEYPDMLAFDRGNVGIGNSSPSTDLHIGPNAITNFAYRGLWVAPNSTSAVITVRNSGGQELGFLANAGGGNYLGSWTNHPLNIRTNNVDRMTFDTAGNVGIGNTAPGTLLQVGPGTPTLQNYAGLWVAPNSTSAVLHLKNSGGTEAGILAFSTGSVYMGVWSNHPLILRTNNADRITIAAAGAVTIPGLVTASAGISFGQDTLTQYDQSPAVWTPVITPTSGAFTTLTYTGQVGKSTRIGNCVFYSGALTIAAGYLAGTASGNARFSLPVACVSYAVGSGYYSSGASAVNATFNPVNAAAYGFMATTTVSPQYLQCSALVAGQTFFYGGFYFV